MVSSPEAKRSTRRSTELKTGLDVAFLRRQTRKRRIVMTEWEALGVIGEEGSDGGSVVSVGEFLVSRWMRRREGFAWSS
jgi:hypothetical protein